MSFRLRSFLTILTLTISALAVTAHEFWLEPVRFVVAVGARVHLGFWVGESFAGERWEAAPKRFATLHQRTPTGTRTDLTAAVRAGSPDSLATTLTFAEAGTHLLAMRSQESLITLDGPKFTAYLREEGLDNALKTRAQRKQTAQPGREAYRRCAKTLVLVGNGPAAATDTACLRPIGFPLELVALQNPYALAAGAAVPVRVLVAGKPAPAGVVVQVWQRSPNNRKAGAPTRLTTDARGQVQVPRQPGGGPVLVATVRMEAYPKGKAKTPAPADWRSTWASLTFGGR